MARLFSKIFLSGDDGDGAGHLVSGTASTAMTTIHTAVTDTAGFDEVYVWMSNFATADRLMTINMAGGNKFSMTIPPLDGLHLVVPGLPVRNAKVMSAFATVADEVLFMGYAHRATAT
jgi:hypothetical protein